MRIWNRLKTVLPLLLAISISANVAGQGIPGAPGGGFSAMNTGMAGPSGIGYQGMAPGFQSHPYISPFDNAIEKHFSSDGLWYRDAISHFEPRGRKYTYNVQLEWLRGKVRKLNGVVGDPDAVFPSQQMAFGGVTPDLLAFDFLDSLQMRKVPDVRTHGLRLNTIIKSREGWRFSLNTLWNPKSAGEYNSREIVDSYRIDEVDALFLEATGGIGNPGPFFTNLRNTSDLRITEDIILNAANDDIGLLLDPSELFDGEADFGARGTAEDVLNRTLLLLPSIPLQNGFYMETAVPPFSQPTNNGIISEGVPQYFDIDYTVRHTVTSFGAGAHFESDTMFERQGIKFRRLVGGRYMRINEGFDFRGTDSGLDYSGHSEDDRQASVELLNRIDDDNNFVVDDLTEAGAGAGAGAGGGGGGGGGFEANNPSATQLLIRSFVDNQVQSELGGLEFGFGYDFGDWIGTTISGSTRFGALLNEERIRLRGDNIGDTFTTEAVVDPEPGAPTEQLRDMFDTATTNGLTQNAFADSRGGMHLSPMFEQSFSAQVPLFHRIPVLRDMKILENASLQAGYTFLWIGEVADPNRSIVWQSNPRAGLFPTINVKRDNFYQNTLRIGVSSQY
jgi:hypothetical protein